MINTVLIDIDNTLLDFNQCSLQAIRQGFEKWGLLYFDSVYLTFERINNRLWRQIECGTLTFSELELRRWNDVFRALGLDGLDGSAFEADFRGFLHETAVPVMGAMELVRYLSGKYRLCAASNALQHQQEHRLEKVGMLSYFHAVYTSESCGYCKPDLQFYQVCSERLGYPTPQEVMVIGDSLTSDIAGAVDAGFYTCWYNPAGKPLPEGQRCDRIVRTLEEIRAFL